ncbi:MAG: ABC transporter permease subunit [Bdellovibrionaceae bacterium]|nr:ABC transporter permease subunit [Pseudobdellovibrionaceae bacterium]
MNFFNRIILNYLSPPSQRRWKSFIGQRRARVGLWIFFIVLFFSLTAEIWSNHKPLYMAREVPIAEGSLETERRHFFPAMLSYTAAEMGVFDTFDVNYAEVVKSDREQGKNTIAIFPFNQWDPYVQAPDTLMAPSADHWLGTDNLGRDVTARLLYGVRVSMTFGLMFWLFTFLIGVLIGSVQGYIGGRTDFMTERLKELFEIIPFLSVVILINGLMQSQSIWVTLMIVVIFSWVSISSQLRASFLSLRRRDFCEAARAMGASHARIIFKHILPNALTPILTLTPFTISSGIAFLAVLDYLGFGLNPPTPSLGELLQQGRNYIINAPWLLLAPTGALATMLISINLVGESLRQAFDPKKS